MYKGTDFSESVSVGDSFVMATHDVRRDWAGPEKVAFLGWFPREGRGEGGEVEEGERKGREYGKNL